MLPRFETGYVHIGTEKTGSSTIQTFLEKNRAQLQERGYCVPSVTCSTSRRRLVAFALNHDQAQELAKLRLLDCDTSAPDFREKFAREFSDQIEATPHSARFLIVSSEHLHSRLVRPGEIERLRDFLSRFCRALRIIIYLRRQDRLAVSLHSTRISCGGAADEPILPPGTPRYYCFDRLLQDYGRVFGAENITARLFEREQWVEQDLITDFLAACGIEDRSGMLAVDALNTSVAPAARRFISEMQRRWPSDKADLLPDLGYFQKLITYQYPGREFVPRTAAQEFYQRFAAGNEWVRKNYFPHLGRSTLFDENFAEYPEERTTDSDGFGEAVDIALEIFATRSVEWGRLAHLLVGKRLRRRFRWQRAAENFGYAVQIAPRDSVAHIELVFTLLLLRKVSEAREAARAAAAALPQDKRIAQLNNSLDRAAWLAFGLPLWWKTRREAERLRRSLQRRGLLAAVKAVGLCACSMDLFGLGDLGISDFGIWDLGLGL